MGQFVAEIDIMPKKELLDPQGKAIESGFRNLNLNSLSQVRIGKHVTMHVEAVDIDQAWDHAETACKNLLANPIMEFYEIVIVEQ